MPAPHRTAAAGTQVDTAAVMDWAKGELAGYKLPRTFLQVDGELPKNAMGKVNKKELVKLFD
eukprot:SAG22_NODE_1013_length_6027_cov_4.804318_2_plen_62_part_00